MSDYVYHGSHEKFGPIVPKQQRRYRNNIKIFDQVSFHATPHYWIALSYTCQHVPFEVGGKKYFYNKGVDLYKDDQIVSIVGIESLEKSLEMMYG